MTHAQELGRFAEDIAADYLISLNWLIIGRNLRNEYGELDIAALDKISRPEELVIIEVRCRTIGMIQSPLDSIGPKKLRTLVNSAREFVNSSGWPGFWRIDVIGVTLRDKDSRDNWQLEHIRDITEGMNIVS